MSLSPNVTTKCEIVCPFLTELCHDLDTGVYYCSYEEWAYAIAALVCTIASILPCGLLLSCLAKRRKRRQKRMFHQISRQISVTSTDAGSKFGQSDSEYESFHSPILTRGTVGHRGIHPGMYGTFSSLPDTFGPTAPYASQHGIKHPYLSQGDLRATGTTGDINPGIGLPFDFSHFEDKQDDDHRTSVVSEPNRQRFQVGNLYPDISRSCNSFVQCVDTSGPINERTGSCQSLSKEVDNTDSTKKAEDTMVENIADGDQQSAVSSRVPCQGSFSSSVKNDTDEEDSVHGTSPYMYTLPTRKDFEDHIINCVSKKPEDERNGTFLIRDSLSNPENKVLMVYCKSMEVPRNIFYFKICQSGSGRIYVEGPTNDTFESIDSLILYHRNYRSFFPCFLAECLGVNFAFRATLHPNMGELGRQSFESS